MIIMMKIEDEILKNSKFELNSKEVIGYFST